MAPAPLIPLGVKGAAESGTIGAPAAIISAVEDALRPLDVAPGHCRSRRRGCGRSFERRRTPENAL
jgi:hypothetical protein